MNRAGPEAIQRAHDEHARLGRALRDLGGLMVRLGEALDGREAPENLVPLAKRIVADFDRADGVGWFAALSDREGLAGAARIADAMGDAVGELIGTIEELAARFGEPLVGVDIWPAHDLLEDLDGLEQRLRGFGVDVNAEQLYAIAAKLPIDQARREVAALRKVAPKTRAAEEAREHGVQPCP